MAEAVIVAGATKKVAVTAKMGAKKAFGEYDIEKVFWQTLYAEGIFGLSWAVWEVYKWVYGVMHMNVQETAANVLVPHSCKSVLGGMYYTCVRCPGGSFKTKAECEAHLETVKEGGDPVQSSKSMEDIIWNTLDMVFGKYGALVLFGIPVLFAVSEFRDLQKRKKALKQAGLL